MSSFLFCLFAYNNQSKKTDEKRGHIMRTSQQLPKKDPKSMKSLTSPTSKRIFNELLNIKQGNMKVSTDNLSGSILIFVPVEGQDRFKHQMKRSKELKSIEEKIIQMQNELEYLHQSGNAFRNGNSHDKSGSQELKKMEDQFEFVTSPLQNEKGTLHNLIPSIVDSAFMNNMLPKSQESMIYSNNSRSLQPPSQTMAGKNHAACSADNSQVTEEFLRNNTQGLTEVKEGFMQGSKENSIAEYMRKQHNSLLINVHDQFTHAQQDYSNLIASAYNAREEDKHDRKKNKTPKFVICNSLLEKGCTANKSEHLMRIFNKEHKPSVIQIYVPSFPLVKNPQDVSSAKYMENYKPIKISDDLKVEDAIPRYLQERIEKDLKQFKEEGQVVLSSQQNSSKGLGFGETATLSELNKAFIRSSYHSGESIRTQKEHSSLPNILS